MSNGVTPEGFSRPTLDEIVTARTDQLRGVHGADTYADPDGPDGQQLAIEGEAVDTLWQVAEDVYNSMNPNAAKGASLRRIGLLSGLTPLDGYNAVVTVRAHLEVGAPAIPAGSIVQDTVNGVKYALDTALGPSVSSSEDLTTTATATVAGTSKSLAGNVTKIVTPVYGWIDVTNPTDSDTGVAAETEEHFRQRRTRSVAAPAQGITDAMRSALEAIAGVGRVKVWENSTGQWADVKAGDKALPPHSVAVLTEYNIIPAIAETIFLKKSQGVTLHGSYATTVQDSKGFEQPIKYTVASLNFTALKVEIEYSEIPGEGFGGADGETTVKEALSDWINTNVDLGGDVVWSYLFAPALDAVVGRTGGRAIRISSLKVGLQSGTAGTVDITLPWNGTATLNVSDITMTAV